MAKKANSAFMKPLSVDAELAQVVGKGPMPRSEVVKKLWAYIKKNGLQDQKNKRDDQSRSPNQNPAHARHAHFTLFMQRLENRRRRAVGSHSSDIFSPKLVLIKKMRKHGRDCHTQKKRNSSQAQHLINI